MKKKLFRPRDYCCLCCYFDSDCEDITSDYDVDDDKKKPLISDQARDLEMPSSPQVHVTVSSIQPDNELLLQSNPRMNTNLKLDTKALFEKIQDLPNRPVNQDIVEFQNTTNSDLLISQSLLGFIIFSLKFNIHESIFIVHLYTAHNLPKKDPNGFCDPYVKIFLLPDKKKKEISKIKFKDLNPDWNEKFIFKGLTCKKLREKELCLQIYDYDRFGSDDFIGEVRLPLTFDFNEISVNEKMYTCDIKEVQSKSTNCGNLHLSLCYSMKHATISITIIKATNLRPMDIGGLADPYVKVWLLNDGRRVEKRKTKMIKNTLNPEFNETFVFKHGFRNFNSVALEVIVVDYDIFGRNEIVGMILLGYKSGYRENQHWTQMKSRPNENIEEVHILKQFYPSIYI